MKRLLPLLLVFLLLGTGCSDTVNGASLARPAVTRFREQMKARQYAEIYTAGHKDFQAAVTKEKMVALLSAVDRKLGALIEANEVNWNVRTNNGVTYAVLVYSCKYAEGESTETFTYRVSDGEARLLGYNISSLEMLIK